MVVAPAPSGPGTTQLRSVTPGNLPRAPCAEGETMLKVSDKPSDEREDEDPVYRDETMLGEGKEGRRKGAWRDRDENAEESGRLAGSGDRKTEILLES